MADNTIATKLPCYYCGKQIVKTPYIWLVLFENEDDQYYVHHAACYTQSIFLRDEEPYECHSCEKPITTPEYIRVMTKHGSNTVHTSCFITVMLLNAL